MMSRWKADLVNGRKTEMEWAEVLEDTGQFKATLPEGKCSEYDLSVYDLNSKDTVTFEVKTDQMALGTGNVAVEVERENINGKTEPSGLSVSTADFYVYKILHKKYFYYVSTDDLRKFITTNNFRKIKGGDGMRSIMVLIPINDFIAQCTSVKRKTLEEFKHDRIQTRTICASEEKNARGQKLSLG